MTDTHGSITFATWDMAAMLGYPVKKLLKTKLEALLPPPYNAMHSRWLRDPPPTVPPTSCRAGAVVHMRTSANVQVPVKLRVHQQEENSQTKHIVRVGDAL